MLRGTTCPGIMEALANPSPAQCSPYRAWLSRGCPLAWRPILLVGTSGCPALHPSVLHFSYHGTHYACYLWWLSTLNNTCSNQKCKISPTFKHISHSYASSYSSVRHSIRRNNLCTTSCTETHLLTSEVFKSQPSLPFQCDLMALSVLPSCTTSWTRNLVSQRDQCRGSVHCQCNQDALYGDACVYIWTLLHY